MSLLSALDAAISALRVTQLQVANVSNNISNAADPNYTRKSVLTSGRDSGGGLGGVEVIGFTRAEAPSLATAYLASISEGGRVDAQQTYFAEINDLMGISSNNPRLTAALNNFSAAWQSLNAAPEDSVRQQQVVITAQAFAAELRRVAGGIEDVDRAIQLDLNNGVERINEILRQIQSLNNRVADTQAANQQTGDLKDQRDALVRELATFVTIRTQEAADGRLRVFTPNGFTLLDRDPTPLSFDGTNILSGSLNVNSVMRGGKLQSLLDMRADNSPAVASAEIDQEVIRKLRSQLNLLATSFISTVGSPTTFAAAYNTATTNAGELAANFFTGTDRFNIDVNAALLAGTSTIKQAAADPVVQALVSSPRNFSADGLAINQVSYNTFGNAILSRFGAAKQTIEDRQSEVTASRDAFKERLSATVNVNIDEELVQLTLLQNSYGAAARVVTTVQEMFDTIDRIF